ncbi:hypothetical protein OKW30_008019 [Paraburkholderia sp. Clong3]|uniref:hypothetical protein n=1 Tax=Paraburkholderia sp. Clong3 TaxID=2991061 RepID=UPI003D25B166
MIRQAMDRLDEFRNMAAKKGVDADAFIQSIGGAPDLARFGYKPQSTGKVPEKRIVATPTLPQDMRRGLLTDDGYLLLEVNGKWTDGDMTFRPEEVEGEIIRDVHVRPDLAERVARILSASQRDAIEARDLPESRTPRSETVVAELHERQ